MQPPAHRHRETVGSEPHAQRQLAVDRATGTRAVAPVHTHRVHAGLGDQHRRDHPCRRVVGAGEVRRQIPAHRPPIPGGAVHEVMQVLLAHLPAHRLPHGGRHVACRLTPAHLQQAGHIVLTLGALIAARQRSQHFRAYVRGYGRHGVDRTDTRPRIEQLGCGPGLGRRSHAEAPR
ncbi:Uncharacterised protein [Mycobacteroides abscessus subsp. abscessus]|nr:Uncharacterised protein [Mycobacteroides abscessus subsp. abscessus]